MALMRHFSLLALLICTPLFGQAKAQIDGPSEQQAGNLVVLNSVASVSDALKWVIPESLAGRYIQTGEQLAFSVRESGSFTFHLVAVTVDETNAADIDVATHTVTITDGFGDPCPEPEPGEPDKPTDPDEPDQPEPVPDFAELEKLSKDAAASLSDPATATALAKVLRSIKLADLPTMRATVAGAVEAVMLGRNRESQSKDWLGIWRKPVDESIQVETAEQYLAALKAIASGLEAAIGSTPAPSPAPAPAPQKLIKMMTRVDCSWCSKWRDEVKPGLLAKGWKVQELTSGGSVPRFEVIVGGETNLLIGFQPATSFEKFLK